MLRRPRPPSAPLLTRGALRFIFATGTLKAALGLGLFFGLPALDYGGGETVTAVFLYESLAQLAFVYPSRHITARPARNKTLNWIVGCSVALQLLTVMSPALRNVLGLEPLDVTAYGLVFLAIAVSVLGASLASRITEVGERASSSY